MGVTNYMTVNGKIRSEQRSGEAHSRDYVLDPLGSVIQIYQNGWPIADSCYEPYGGIYTQWNMEGKTFTWLGGWGYRQTGVEWSSVYVRARHYSRSLSNWTSIDPLWPSEMAYGYVEGRVMTGVDPSGMQVLGAIMVCHLNSRTKDDGCPECIKMSDAELCNHYRSKYAIPIDLNAAVACCGARSVPCVFVDNIKKSYRSSSSTPGQIDILRKCALENEKVHVKQRNSGSKDVECTKGVCGWMRVAQHDINTNPRRFQARVKSVECPSSVASLKCLHSSDKNPCRNVSSILCSTACSRCRELDSCPSYGTKELKDYCGKIKEVCDLRWGRKV